MVFFHNTVSLVTITLLQSITAEFQMSSIVSLVEKSLMVLNQTNLPLNRNLRAGQSISAQFQNLQQYGCWCYFDTFHGLGRGVPVDRFDIECMKLHHATTCIKEDSCDGEQDFTPVMSIGLDGKMAYDCIAANGGNACLEANCYAYTWFTKSILDIFLDPINGELPNYANKASLGFDSDTCHLNTAKKTIEEEFCCGAFAQNTKRPIRVPSGKNRQCCENSNTGDFVTYDPLISECCVSGEVMSPGSC